MYLSENGLNSFGTGASCLSACDGGGQKFGQEDPTQVNSTTGFLTLPSR
jgi:hypothetical protein